MNKSQRYILTIWDLFNVRDGAICGADSEVAILGDGLEIDRMKFTGKYQGEDGYRRAYTGLPGLTAELVSGPGRIHFAAEDLKVISEA
ncbi:hypothetical protein [Pseudomonas yamanorum]|uniref:hypothetical protein n=1 Tax=Pseudomonas yamanorum TaxID=515393 RepID=UPI003BA22040